MFSREYFVVDVLSVVLGALKVRGVRTGVVGRAGLLRALLLVYRGVWRCETVIAFGMNQQRAQNSGVEDLKNIPTAHPRAYNWNTVRAAVLNLQNGRKRIFCRTARRPWVDMKEEGEQLLWGHSPRSRGQKTKHETPKKRGGGGGPN